MFMSRLQDNRRDLCKACGETKENFGLLRIGRGKSSSVKLSYTHKRVFTYARDHNDTRNMMITVSDRTTMIT